MTPPEVATGLVAPGRGRGLLDVHRNRYLLSLITRKEIQVRYRGSVLGILWSYIKPAMQFAVFFVAMGLFLGLNRGVENYAVYLFSGIILMNLFNESFRNAAKSIVENYNLIKKIYLPRELFPVSSLWVALAHFFPQVVVLVVACLFFGWVPGLAQVGAVLLGTAIVAVFSLGIGLLFATANVFFRDAENIVELLVMITTWASPVLYMWTMVRDAMAPWMFALYMLNPLTVATELFHFGFWQPTLDASSTWALPDAFFSLWVPVAIGVSLLFLFLGDLAFRRHEGTFAQEL